MRVALTIDDAPSVSGEGVPFVPERMDRVREVLGEAGVRRCVAFVIGERARANEGPLERWLEAGFELGNHGERHRAASACGTDESARDIARCDELLASLGAFDGGRRRYFRPPFGDRGASPEHRLALHGAWEDLGYELADVSVDLYDWLYEEPLARAIAFGDARAVTQIGGRYLRAASRELTRSEARSRAQLGGDWVQIAACHFGDVSVRGLQPVVERLGDAVDWCGLEESVDCEGYRVIAGDPAENGILGSRLARSPLQGPLRRGARLLARAGFLDQVRLGPLWPRWSA